MTYEWKRLAFEDVDKATSKKITRRPFCIATLSDERRDEEVTEEQRPLEADLTWSNEAQTPYEKKMQSHASYVL